MTYTSLAIAILISAMYALLVVGYLRLKNHPTWGTPLELALFVVSLWAVLSCIVPAVLIALRR